VTSKVSGSAARGVSAIPGARHRAKSSTSTGGATSSKGFTAARILVALVSVLVLALTGGSWWVIRGAVRGITVSQALGADAPKSTGGGENILLIGLDSRKDQAGNDLPAEILDKLHAGDSEAGGYNTNTLILVHLSADNKVSAFSIPRDDYVAVSGIPGYSNAKIKETYGLKKADIEQKLLDRGVTDQHRLETQGREAGRAATLAAVRNLTGVPIDFFAEINLAGFYDVAASLGGVEVCLNHPVYDDYSGADFPAGRQTLTAEQALAFVRQRHGLENGDLDRTHRQQAFLVSIMRKLQDAGSFTDLSKLNSLIAIARKDIVLSSGWNEAQFRRIGTVSGGNVEYQTLPVLRYDTIDGQDVNIVDPTAIRAEVNAAFGGGDAAAATTHSTPSSTIDVINAGDATGLAGIISRALSQRGYTAGQVRNPLSGEPTQTGVDYGSGSATDAQNLATMLGIDTPPRLDATQEPGHIRVILGADYILSPTVNQPDSSPTTVGSADTTVADTTTPTPDRGQPVEGAGMPCVN
jgi:LCP family protein required for cell wall assembly